MALLYPLYIVVWCFIAYFTFYIQSFSLTECIVIVGVQKTGVVCLCVCVSVCLSVCEQLFAETTGPISTKLTNIGPLMV